jgi:hypothetical protein
LFDKKILMDKGNTIEKLIHHQATQFSGPFLVDDLYYEDGFLLSFMTVLPASIIVATIAGAITTAIIARALNKSRYSFWLVFSNPA